MNILCDTNILIEFYKNNSEVLWQLNQIGARNLAISVITKTELLYGAETTEELTTLEQSLAFCYCYPIDSRVSILFSEFMESYALSYRPTIPDMLVAATAIVHNVPLYTLNPENFEFIPKIWLYN
jgi:predicted nucleic acid-binding protein